MNSVSYTRRCVGGAGNVFMVSHCAKQEASNIALPAGKFLQCQSSTRGKWYWLFGNTLKMSLIWNPNSEDIGFLDDVA